MIPLPSRSTSRAPEFDTKLPGGGFDIQHWFLFAYGGPLASMFETLQEISDWILSFADSGWAVLILAVTSFTESIFFPIPPDPLLIATSLANSSASIWYAGLVTVASVGGAMVGHWLGLRFGRPLMNKMFSESKIEPVERMFNKYGLWAILLAAFTPLPYKLFAIMSGVLDLDRKTFLIASLIGRGGRFFAIGILIFILGEDIKMFLDNHFQTLTIAVGVTVIIAIVIIAVFYARRGTNSNAS